MPNKDKDKDKHNNEYKNKIARRPNIIMIFLQGANFSYLSILAYLVGGLSAQLNYRHPQNIET